MKTLLVMTVLFLAPGVTSRGQDSPISDQSFAFKTYSTNYAFYPFVSVYMRTFDANHEPLTNLNASNLALMVKGRAYDKSKVDQFGNLRTYSIETLQNRGEAFRTIFVWDCSKTMEGQPFLDARDAIIKFINAKRAGDEVAILAIRDTKEGYDLISNFEKNSTMLLQRIADVKCDGQKTRLYDAIRHATEMCFAASQGDINATGAEYIVLSSIVVLSDGKDEGSAIDRGELISQINMMKIPIPIMSLAYSKVDTAFFKNLEALSKATFGRYWTVQETQEFARTVEKIHQINRQDYVVTFRVYDIPVDGEKHSFKIGLTYPSNTGKMLMNEGTFEAIDSSPLKLTPRGRQILEKLDARYPVVSEGPYMQSLGAPGAATPNVPAGAAVPAAIPAGVAVPPGVTVPGAAAPGSVPPPAAPVVAPETAPSGAAR
jgi:hypothetical protein